MSLRGGKDSQQSCQRCGCCPERTNASVFSPPKKNRAIWKRRRPSARESYERMIERLKESLAIWKRRRPSARESYERMIERLKESGQQSAVSNPSSPQTHSCFETW